MMAAILNSVMLVSNTAILDRDTLLSSLRFTQKHSHSTLTLTQTNSIWLKLFHFHLTWCWWPSWIWLSWIQQSFFFLSKSLTLAKICSHHWHKKFTQSFWLNLMMAAILNSAMVDWHTAILDSAIFNPDILNLANLDSAILVFPFKLTHTCQDWFPPFAQEKLHSFLLTQHDDGSHLEFCHVGLRHWHLGFRHLVIFSQIHSKNTLTPLWLWL